MPTRPPCSGREQGEVRTIHIYVKSGSKALHIRMNCIDWLLVYAADEHHFQGIARNHKGPDPTTAVADYVLAWDFNSKAFEGTIAAGLLAGQSVSCAPTVLRKDVWDKLNDLKWVDVVFSKAILTNKRKACKRCLQMWCEATSQGHRDDVESHWRSPSPSPTKTPKA